jgi:SAM-dependent methyltransferase
MLFAALLPCQIRRILTNFILKWEYVYQNMWIALSVKLQAGTAARIKPVQVLADKLSRFRTWLMTDNEGNVAPSRFLDSVMNGDEVDSASAFDLADGGIFMETEAWQADRPEILEAMWGEGWHLPLGEHLTHMMTSSFGLNREKSVLDLSGGMGGAGRYLAEQFHCYVTALEPDLNLINRGKELIRQAGLGAKVTLDHYDPVSFAGTKRFDAIIVRNLRGGLKDPSQFIAQISRSLKEGGHVSWTDYVLVTQETPPAAPLAAWLDSEAGLPPMLLTDIAPLWAQHGFDIRVSEDRSALVIDEITQGLSRLRDLLQRKAISRTTRPKILAEAERWALTAGAFHAGMRCYRFYTYKR